MQPLLPPVLISPETAAPWVSVFFFALIAGLPRLLAWILNAPGE